MLNPHYQNQLHLLSNFYLYSSIVVKLQGGKLLLMDKWLLMLFISVTVESAVVVLQTAAD